MAHGSEMAVDAIPDDYESFRTLLLSRREAMPKRLKQLAAFALAHPGGDGVRNGGGHCRTRGRAALHAGAVRQEPRL